MKIGLRGVPASSALAARIDRRLVRELGRIQPAPITAVVTFIDDNGPKGGPAMRCALSVRLPRRPMIRVQDVAETAWLAFDGSFASLKRELAVYRERWRKQRRYPKKYFAARRFLA